MINCALEQPVELFLSLPGRICRWQEDQAESLRKDFALQVNCPHCKKKSRWQDNQWRPFCSERCKMIDLGNWADEDYRIAGTQTLLDEEVEKLS